MTKTNNGYSDIITKSDCQFNRKSVYPLSGKCRKNSIVYNASVAAPNIPTRHYFRLWETEFQTRFYNRRPLFKDYQKINSKELSKPVPSFQNRGIEPHISWFVVCKAAGFRSCTKRCNICLVEKLAIL